MKTVISTLTTAIMTTLVTAMFSAISFIPVLLCGHLGFGCAEEVSLQIESADGDGQTGRYKGVQGITIFYLNLLAVLYP